MTLFADLEVIAVMVMIVSGVHGTLAFLLFYGVKEVRPTLVTENYILVGKVQISQYMWGSFQAWGTYYTKKVCPQKRNIVKWEKYLKPQIYIFEKKKKNS